MLDALWLGGVNLIEKQTSRQTVICKQKRIVHIQKRHLHITGALTDGQRQPIIFALRARFLGRFRIRPVVQSLSLLDRSVNWQLSILPGRLHPSTFDVQVLNYCVRNGNRWNHLAIATRYYVERCSLKTSQKIEMISSILVLHDLLPNRLRLLDKLFPNRFRSWTTQ